MKPRCLRPGTSRLCVAAADSRRPPPASSVPSFSGRVTSSSAPPETRTSSSAALATPTVSIVERHEFRRGVGLCVVNREGLVFAAKRMDDRHGTWQMPQGGIDPLENPLVAALRELKEETGMTSVKIVSSIDRWLDYEWPTRVACHLTGRLFRYRGQTQKWILMHFNGADEEIDLGCHGHPEFSEWRWMKLEDLPHSVVDFKRGVYQAVAGHFGPHVERLGGREKN